MRSNGNLITADSLKKNLPITLINISSGLQTGNVDPHRHKLWHPVTLIKFTKVGKLTLRFSQLEINLMMEEGKPGNDTNTIFNIKLIMQNTSIPVAHSGRGNRWEDA